MGNGMQRKYNERRMGKMVSDIMKNFQAQLNKGLLVNHIRFYTAPLQKSHHTKFFSCGRQCWFPDANLLSCILALPNIYSFLAGGSLYLQNVSRQTFQSNQRACIWEPCHQKMLSLMFSLSCLFQICLFSAAGRKAITRKIDMRAQHISLVQFPIKVGLPFRLNFLFFYVLNWSVFASV